MKHTLMALAGGPICLLFRIIAPFKDAMRRIYYTSRLKACVHHMDYSVQCDGPVDVGGTKNIFLGRRCRLGTDLELSTMENGSIHIGDDVRINRGGTVTAYDRVAIGDFAIIGEFVSIRDANHGLKKGDPIRYQPHIAKRITIGRDVWIGRGCCVLPGVTIGEGAVIGANSVVTRDIPSFSIAVGIPAKVIRKR